MERARRERAERLWDETQRIKANSPKKIGIGRSQYLPGEKAAFVRLFVFAGWEDLAHTLAPYWPPDRDAYTAPDSFVEQFIDANAAHLWEGVGEGAQAIMAVHGWRGVSEVLSRAEGNTEAGEDE